MNQLDHRFVDAIIYSDKSPSGMGCGHRSFLKIFTNYTYQLQFIVYVQVAGIPVIYDQKKKKKSFSIWSFMDTSDVPTDGSNVNLKLNVCPNDASAANSEYNIL